MKVAPKFVVHLRQRVEAINAPVSNEHVALNCFITRFLIISFSVVVIFRRQQGLRIRVDFATVDREGRGQCMKLELLLRSPHLRLRAVQQ